MTVSALPGCAEPASGGTELPEAAWRLQLALAGEADGALQCYGLSEQAALATLIRERLDDPGLRAERAACQHLQRLQQLLAEQLAALNAHSRWAKARSQALLRSHDAELDELCIVLGAVHGELIEARTRRLVRRTAARSQAERLAAVLASAETLLPHLPESSAAVLSQRCASLLASIALAHELTMHLDCDAQRLQTLLGTIGDSVLLRLPSVCALLGDSHAEASETRIFRARDALEFLISTLRSKPHEPAAQS